MTENIINYMEIEKAFESAPKKPSKIWVGTKKALYTPIKPFTKEARESRAKHREEQRATKEALRAATQMATEQLRFVNDQATVEDVIKNLYRSSKKLYNMAKELEETIR